VHRLTIEITILVSVREGERDAEQDEAAQAKHQEA